jgi:hypothetical protein
VSSFTDAGVDAGVDTGGLGHGVTAPFGLVRVRLDRGVREDRVRFLVADL